MRSKTFSSDYFKQQFKRQIWIMGFMAFLFFLALPVSLLIEFENMRQAGYVLTEQRDSFMLYILRGDFQYVLVLCCGIFTGIYQFHYLHSSRKVDFYHSLPIRKESLYRIKLIAVYLDFLIPYTIMMAFCLILGLSRGLMTSKALMAYFLVWILYQLAYLLAYGVASVAMLLTGRIFVGIMGSGVLLFVTAMFAGVLESYKNQFFYTYPGCSMDRYWMYRFSPGIIPLFLRESLTDGLQIGRVFTGESIVTFIVMLLLTVGFLAVGYFLMKKRPSEAAGSSMAFSIPARVIHVVLCILGALYSGLFVISMMYDCNIIWLLVSVIFGGFLFYILIQFIYTMDFRKVLRYKWQLLVVEVISVAAASLFYFDWIGFDSYLPERENLYSVAFSIPDNHHYDYYYLDGEYIDAFSYRLDNMDLVVTDELYDMLEDAVATSTLVKSGSCQEEGLKYIEVRYKLQNGQERNRFYQINLKKYKKLFASLYDQEDFRKVMMPMYSLWTTDGTYDISLVLQSEYTELFGSDMKKAQEFIQVLKSDYETISGEVFINEFPMATLNIYAEELHQSYEVYIYPSCTQTIAYLENSGYSMESCLTVERILKIDVEDYRQQENEDYAVPTSDPAGRTVELEAVEGRYTSYTDPEQIEQIIPALLENNYDYLWQETCEDVYATVTYMGHDGYQIQMSCILLEDELPDFLELN